MKKLLSVFDLGLFTVLLRCSDGCRGGNRIDRAGESHDCAAQASVSVLLPLEARWPGRAIAALDGIARNPGASGDSNAYGHRSGHGRVVGYLFPRRLSDARLKALVQTL
jgi:hypothetical protein